MNTRASSEPTLPGRLRTHEDFQWLDLLPARGMVARLSNAVEAAKALHVRRQRTVEGFTLTWCVECRQDWPCPTSTALDFDEEERP